MHGKASGVQRYQRGSPDYIPNSSRSVMMGKASQLESRLLATLVGKVIVRDLRRSFSNIRLIGDVPEVPPDKPLVLYANHHSFFDGYLGWYVVRTLLNRAFTTWMREWDTFPIFAPLGALPFPEDSASRRAATIRLTISRFRQNSRSAFLYFPEGHLHPQAEGILPFDAQYLRRLSRMIPEAIWIPLCIHVTSWGDALPVALVQFGELRSEVDGKETERLEHQLLGLRATLPPSGLNLLTGKKAIDKSWSLNILSGYFRRFLK